MSKIVIHQQAGFLRSIFLTAFYVFSWMSPVLIALFVAFFLEKSFSFVGVQWQSQNLFLVMLAALLAIGAGLICGFSLVYIWYKKDKATITEFPFHQFSSSQVIVLILVCLLSGVGLYKSFDGSIFEKNYAGASVAWLGYGAWSVTYLISLGLLLGTYLERYRWRWSMVLITTIFFLPFLLSGSRIDFLSFLLAEAIFVGFYAQYGRIKALLGCGGIFVYGMVVAYLVSKLRYLSGFTSVQAVDNISAAIKGIHRMPEGQFYLSTIGYIGVSAFQVIGLVHSGVVEEVGLLKVLGFYAVRMLPGSYFHERPLDISTYLPENIGGGALHALGEGYLILGLPGCILVGAVFGALGAASACSNLLCSKSLKAFHWIILFAPWLMLIRGGWDQFFSLFKSIEILSVILIGMYFANRSKIIFKQIIS